MKRGMFWVFVIFMILSAGIVNAANICSSPSQVILKLSAATNADGENATLSNYDTEICYDQIFTGQAGSGSRDCGAGDEHLVLRLSADTNAHAENASLGNYPVKICYGDLSDCNLESGACTSGRTQIVSLSADTNAHLANDSSYSLSVCCVSVTGAPPPLGAAFWADMTGINVITETEVSDMIKLVVNGGPASTFLTLDIIDVDPINSDNIRTLSGVTDSSGRLEVVWTITEQDYQNGRAQGALDQESVDGVPINYLEFTAYNNTVGFSKTSGSLILNKEPENTPPIPIISNPKHRQIYFTNTQLEFNQSSYDIDGIVAGWEWTIKEGSSFSRSESNFTYSFSRAGLKIITLKVIDNLGKTGEDQIAIIVMESPGMLAFINKPRHLELVRDPSLVVNYLGNDSYVVNYTGACTLDCLAGNCPLQTVNSPAVCGGGPIPVNNAPQDFSSLYFNLTFYSNSGNSFGFNTGGFGNESGQHRYGVTSSQINDKLIVLNLSHFDTNLHERVERVFTLLRGNVGESACVGNQLWEFDSEGNLAGVRNLIGDTENPPACFGPNGVYDGALGDDCTCPSPFYCSPTGEGCVESKITSCSNYTDESNCNNDTYQVAKPGGDPLWDLNNCNDVETAEGIKDCFCGWRPAGACEFIVNVTPWKVSSSGAVCSYECGYLSVEDPAGCVEGYIDLSVNSNFISHTSDPSCNAVYYSLGGAKEKCDAGAGEYKLPCGRPEIELPFFGMMQFGISLVFVLIMYLLMITHRHVFKDD